MAESCRAQVVAPRPGQQLRQYSFDEDSVRAPPWITSSTLRSFCPPGQYPGLTIPQLPCGKQVFQHIISSSKVLPFIAFLHEQGRCRSAAFATSITTLTATLSQKSVWRHPNYQTRANFRVLFLLIHSGIQYNCLHLPFQPLAQRNRITPNAAWVAGSAV